MNYLRLGLAALGGLVASLAVGFLVWWLVPGVIEESHKYPALFRPEEQMMAMMPVALAANFIAILVVAILFAMLDRGGPRIAAGARLGALAGVLAVCNVLHNFANLNIGARLAAGQAGAYFVQWVVAGIVIALIYE